MNVTRGSLLQQLLRVIEGSATEQDRKALLRDLRIFLGSGQATEEALLIHSYLKAADALDHQATNLWRGLGATSYT